jgi:hypothetical protein
MLRLREMMFIKIRIVLLKKISNERQRGRLDLIIGRTIDFIFDLKQATAIVSEMLIMVVPELIWICLMMV